LFDVHPAGVSLDDCLGGGWSIACDARAMPEIIDRVMVADR